MFGGIIPAKVKTQIFGTGPVGCDRVSGVQGGNEVISIGTANIFDTKIVNDEAKGDGACVVFEKPRCMWALAVPVFCKVEDKIVVG
jgi:hypothetical protein